eukprot:g4038.t1
MADDDEKDDNNEGYYDEGDSEAVWEEVKPSSPKEDEDVNKFLKENKVKYDPDKFIKEIESPQSLLILKSKERIKDIFPDMRASDVYKILDAVDEISSNSKSTSSKEKKVRVVVELDH